MKKVFTLISLCLFAFCVSAEILSNGNFEHGLKAWWFYPKNSKNVKVVKSGTPHKNYLQLTPKAENLGINSYKLTVGKILDPKKSYKVSYQLKVKSINQGAAAVSLVFFGKNKSRKQLFLQRIKKRHQNQLERIFSNGR